jgi:multiple sugar transport system permease protein
MATEGEAAPHVAPIERLARGEDPAAGTAADIPGRGGRQATFRLFVYALMILIALVYFTPFFWSVSTSLKTLPESVKSFDLIPNHPTLHAYREALTSFSFGRYTANSAFLATIVTVSNLFLCSLGGYAFARLRFPGRELLFLIVLATLMIPDQLRLVPIFQMLIDFPHTVWNVNSPSVHWNLISTYQGYFLIHLMYATNLFLMRQYFLTIPRDLEEAAKLDAAGYFKTYRKVMLPLAGPALAAVGILTFQGTWNALFWPAVLLQDKSQYTIPIGIANFVGAYQTLWPPLMAASVLAILPILLIFVLFQRYFVAGVAAAGVKG